MLKKIASEKKCTYIDLHPFFKSKNGELDYSFSTNGVHINSKGYAIWKNAIEKYVKISTLELIAKTSEWEDLGEWSMLLE